MRNFFATYKNPITVVIVIILLGGVFAYSKMQTSLFPEITFPKIKVIADAGQQPVKKMMITVTQTTGKCDQTGARLANDPQHYKPWQLRDFGIYELECRY